MLSVSKSLKSEWFAFLAEKGICPDCETDRYVFPKQGELVCLECGTVLKRVYSPLVRCSGMGNDEARHDAPVNKLCFGSSLGNPAISKGFSLGSLCRVIAPNGKEDLGIRATVVRKECMKSQETTITQRLKNYLSMWCKKYGWHDHHLLANSLGYNAEWVGTICSMMNNGKNSKDLARGIFFLNVKKFFGAETAEQIKTELQVKDLYVNKTRDMLTLDQLIN